MPLPTPSLKAGDVEAFVRERCFGACDRGRVGVELEWLTFPVDDPRSQLPLSALRQAAAGAAPLAGGGTVSFEPGGQVELSTLPLPGATACVQGASADAALLRRALLERGVGTVALGWDPVREPRRVLDTPRYVAMEAYFDQLGPQGRAMMCATASVQVNLDLGAPGELVRRWQLAHAVGPVLAAAFANSPARRGGPGRTRSARLTNWSRIDRSRTAPVVSPDGGTADPAADWARYVLQARVMLIWAEEGRCRPVQEFLPFERWLHEGHELGFPTVDDLAYHLTTLFPPVRPRGWLELRMIDALPDPWWRVAAAVTAAVLDDGEASEEAAAATEGSAGLWAQAAYQGLSHPALADSARRCFLAALCALPRMGVDATTRKACEAFFERYVSRGRCPADDVDHPAGPGPALEIDRHLDLQDELEKELSWA